MFTKIRSAMLALAVATIGIGGLVATTDSADARGFHGGGFKAGGGIGRVHVGGRVHLGGGVHIGHRPHIRPIHIGHRPHFRPHIRIGIRPIIRPNWCGKYPWGFRHRCHIHVRWPRPVIVGAPVVATTYAVAPTVTTTARPCTCLTKEYTPDNLVVFKDLCTKEVASAPAGNTQVQLQLPAPEAPVPQK